MADEKQVAQERPEFTDTFNQIQRNKVIYNLLSNNATQNGTYSKSLTELLIKNHADKGIAAIAKKRPWTKEEKKLRKAFKKRGGDLPEDEYYLFISQGQPHTVQANLTIDGGVNQAAEALQAEESAPIIKELQAKIDTLIKAGSAAAEDAKTAKDEAVAAEKQKGEEKAAGVKVKTDKAMQDSKDQGAKNLQTAAGKIETSIKGAKDLEALKKKLKIS